MHFRTHVTTNTHLFCEYYNLDTGINYTYQAFNIHCMDSYNGIALNTSLVSNMFKLSGKL